MKLLKSKKFKLPTLYFITDRKEIKDIPIGVPFIYGNEKDKEYLVRLLEYEVLYQRALATGLPFNFKQILLEAGFEDITFDHCGSMYMDYITEDYNYDIIDNDIDTLDDLNIDSTYFQEYIKDSTAYVNITKLKDLNVFPTWFTDNLEKAVETNIHNFAVFNNNMYNKKLEGMYGALELTSPNKNLIIKDISYSIPKSIATSILVLIKWMSETFYADIIFTGKDSIFIPYEELGNLNVDEIYEKYGQSQECKNFRKIITSDVKHYRTAIVFGDYHSVCDSWHVSEKIINPKDGKKLCQWTIDKLISFHTTSNEDLAGYSEWFDPKEIEIVKDWVEYLK